MDTIIFSFKKLLNINDGKNDAKEIENDCQEFARIYNSTKFTNTNSDTNALERLLVATNVAPVTEPEPINNENIDDNNDGKNPTTDTTKYKTFKSNIKKHLELLQILEGEYGGILPAPSLHERPKFGKQSNFILKDYRIPIKIWNWIEINELPSAQGSLSPANYITRFQDLLWMEEAHQSVQMRRYDMQGVLLAKYDKGFLLPVPGLAEGRPSLMRGDRALLKAPKRSTYYEAYIADVRDQDVILKLHSSLTHDSLEALAFDVSFMSSRTPYRRCHHGVMTIKKQNGREMLFPVPKEQLKSPNIQVKEDAKSLRCFMSELNIYQREGVIRALRNECRPAPYIIFGPPGTGKSVTLIEIALQIYARKQKSKILICANSNASTDLLVSRINNKKLIRDGELIRISAYYRFVNNLIPSDIRGVTDEFDAITKEMFRNYRIVITTCIQAGTLYEFTDRFDYVLIDEAGHANEAESLIALGLLKDDGCAVLAGDPHQLGPVCMSKPALKGGLGISLLERLSKFDVYTDKSSAESNKKSFDPQYITKLIISYRCDARVMSINNQFFYGGDLKFVVKTPNKWLNVLNVKNVLIFHPVKGKERREYASPSWFNANEAIRTLTYINTLYQAGLRPNQVGIITPYRRQIDKIQTLFDSIQLEPCKVSTMEEFQGDEREVIIISTVRASARHIEFDKNFNLGFLFDPKRFNVAISRAKWLVILIGDPDILKKDPYWSEYIKRAETVQSIEVKKQPKRRYK